MSDPQEVINQALAAFIKAANRREDAASAVYDALSEVGALLDWVPDTVEVSGASVPVEVVDRYGLVIELDANGNAVSVYSPYGFGSVE